MHIVHDNLDVLEAHRDLQRRFFGGELSADEYLAQFHQLDAAHSHRDLCANGDGRLATAIVAGRALCSACWVQARGRQ